MNAGITAEQMLAQINQVAIPVMYNALELARASGNQIYINDIIGRLNRTQDIIVDLEAFIMESSLAGRSPILESPDTILNEIFEIQRQARIGPGNIPFEREDFDRELADFRAASTAGFQEAQRQRREAQRDRLNKPPTSNPFSGLGIKGGKLSAPELKGLLDASYDSKVKKVGDFEMDRKLSSSTSKVYRNPVTGQVVVAHRGTAGITDWGNNALYALGGKQAYKLTPRYKEAEKVQRRAEKKYGAKNISTIGHSQGGLQSELLGGRSKEIITLNKATLPFESNTNKNQYDIRSERDVVSGLNPFAKKSKKDVNIKAKTYNPLTEHSGDILDRLGKNKVIGKGVYLKGFGRMRGGVIDTWDTKTPPPSPPRQQEPPTISPAQRVERRPFPMRFMNVKLQNLYTFLREQTDNFEAESLREDLPLDMRYTLMRYAENIDKIGEGIQTIYSNQPPENIVREVEGYLDYLTTGLDEGSINPFIFIDDWNNEVLKPYLTES